MTWEIAVVYVLTAWALWSFLREKISPDQTGYTVFAVLLGLSLFPTAKELAELAKETDWFSGLLSHLPARENLPSPKDLLGVFANEAPITVGAMFILSHALIKCGMMDKVAEVMSKAGRLPMPVFLFLLVMLVAGISAFLNNTPVVVMFAPVVLKVARDINRPASKFLIPVAYAATLGGVCTLLGTSTNVLLNGLMKNAGVEGLSMFELGQVGLPLLLVGGLYLAVFGDKLLPSRETLTQMLPEEARREYLLEVFVKSGSPLIGQTFSKNGVDQKNRFRVVEIIRFGTALEGEPRAIELLEGDRVLISLRATSKTLGDGEASKAFPFLDPAGLEPIAAREGLIFEAVVTANSPLVGQSLHDLNFRQRYRLSPAAVHRRGHSLPKGFELVPLIAGDTILLMGPRENVERMRESGDLALLDLPATHKQRSPGRIAFVSLVFAGVVLVPSVFQQVPISIAALIGCAFIFAGRAITPREAYSAIEWPVMMLIFCMLGLGLAMDKSGGARLLAGHMVDLMQSVVAQEHQRTAMIWLVLGCSIAATEILSNNATAALMAPICIGLGAKLGIDPRAFLIAACIGSSTAFSLPMGYQTYTYVYGIGGYKIRDFVKIGLPLNLICLCVGAPLICWFW